MKKLEQNFRSALKVNNVNENSVWEEVRESLQDDVAFTAITVESERIRIFKVKTVKLCSSLVLNNSSF